MSEYMQRRQYYASEQTNKSGSFDWEEHPMLKQQKLFLPTNKPTGNIRSGLKISIDADGDQQSHELTLSFVGQEVSNNKGPLKDQPKKNGATQNKIIATITHSSGAQVEFSFMTDISLDQFYIWHQEATDGRLPYRLYFKINSRKLETFGQEDQIPKEMLTKFKKEHINDGGYSANKTGYFSPITLDEAVEDRIFKVTPKVSADKQNISYSFDFPGLKSAPVLKVPYDGKQVKDVKKALIKPLGKDTPKDKDQDNETTDLNNESVSTFDIPLEVGTYGDLYTLKIIPGSKPGLGKMWVSAKIGNQPYRWLSPRKILLPWKKGEKTPYEVEVYPQYIAIYFGKKEGKPHLRIHQQTQSQDEKTTTDKNGTQTSFQSRTAVLCIYNQYDHLTRFATRVSDKGALHANKSYKLNTVLTKHNIKDHAWADASYKMPMLRGKTSVDDNLDALLWKNEQFITGALAEQQLATPGSADLLLAYLQCRLGFQGMWVYQSVLNRSKKIDELPSPALTALKASRAAVKNFANQANPLITPSFSTFWHESIANLPQRLESSWNKLNYKEEWVSLHLRMLAYAKYIKGTQIYKDDQLDEKAQEKKATQVHNRGKLREKLAKHRQQMPQSTIKVPVIFYPDAANVTSLSDQGTDREKKSQMGLTGVPIPVYCYKKGDTWYAQSFVNLKTAKPFPAEYTLTPKDKADYTDDPPPQLFKALDSKDHLPPGWLFYEIPGKPQKSEPIRINSDPKFEDYAGWFAATALGLGLTAITMGAGAPLSAVFFLGAGISGAAGATVKIARKSENGTLGTMEKYLAWLDIAGGLLAVLQFGRLGSGIAQAANATNKSASILSQLSPLQGNLYYKIIKIADLGVDTTMVVVGGREMWDQIAEIYKRDMSPEQRIRAVAFIIGTYAVQLGMFAATFGTRFTQLPVEAKAELAAVQVNSKMSINLKSTPKMVGFKAKGLVQGEVLDGIRVHIGAKATEALAEQLHKIKPDEWMALKKLYPEEDLIRALHFFDGDLQKSRQYLSKRMGYTPDQEAEYFRSLKKYERLDHQGIGKKQQELDTKKEAISDTEGDVLLAKKGVGGTQGKQASNEIATQKLEAEIKNIEKQTSDLDSHKRKDEFSAWKLGEERTAYEKTYKLPHEPIPVIDDPKQLTKVLNNYEQQFMRQADDFRLEAKRLEGEIVRDIKALEELKKKAGKYENNFDQVEKEFKKEILADKNKDLKNAMTIMRDKRANKGKVVSPKDHKRVHRKVNKAYKKREAAAEAKARQQYEKTIAENNRLLEDLDAKIAKQREEKIFTSAQVTATQRYYGMFSQHSRLVQQARAAEGQIAQLKQRAAALKAQELPRLQTQSTDLAQQLKQQQGQVNSLEQKLATARKNLQSRQAQLSPELKAYQIAMQRYHASHAQVGKHRQSQTAVQQVNKSVGWLQGKLLEQWKKIKPHLQKAWNTISKDNLPMSKAIWKLAKGLRGVTMHLAKTHGLPAYLRNPVPLDELAQEAYQLLTTPRDAHNFTERQQCAAIQQELQNTRVANTLPQLKQMLEQMLGTPELKQNERFKTWLGQYLQMMQTLEYYSQQK